MVHLAILPRLADCDAMHIGSSYVAWMPGTCSSWMLQIFRKHVRTYGTSMLLRSDAKMRHTDATSHTYIALYLRRYYM